MWLEQGFVRRTAQVQGGVRARVGSVPRVQVGLCLLSVLRLLCCRSGPRTFAPPCARSAGCRCWWNCCSPRPTRWCVLSPSLCATFRWTDATRTSLVRTRVGLSLDSNLVGGSGGPAAGAGGLVVRGLASPASLCPSFWSSSLPHPV